MAVPIVNVKAHYETKNEIETLIEGKAIEKNV